ncbi:MAG: DUF4832 domain-containing protein [Deltaproteobacteria bacterium]|nr:DUF4832 domain-containing protein [Deltaproteobacteria bacterium]
MKKLFHYVNAKFLVCEILVAALSLVMTQSASAASAPRIVISGSKTEGSLVTLSVSGGGIYAWDIGGKGKYKAKGASISRILSNSGPLTIRVKRISGGSAAARRAKGSITVGSFTIKNRRPSVDLGGPYGAQAGSSVTFRAEATDPSPADVAAGFSFSWNFGDGNVASGKNLKNASHTYSRAGTYTVSVVVRDKDGAKSHASSASVIVVAPGNEPPPSSPPTSPPSSPPSGPLAIATPQELADEIITNPGIGWQSCDKVNTSGQDSQGFKNKVAFIKYYWKDLETADGVFNWTVFDQRLNQANNSGQTVSFRVVISDNLVSAPQWLKNLGVPGYTYVAEGGPQTWTPDMNNAVVQQKYFQFLQAMGQRYDNDVRVNDLDISGVGLWGEWHWGDTTPQVPMPTQATMNLIVDKHFEYFPNKPKIAQLEHQTTLNYAISRGSGYRGDCWGNMQWQNRISPPGMYAQRVAGAQAQNAWKTAPVAMESCWTMAYWANQNWDTDYLLQWAVDNHVSEVHNKNSSVPTHMIPKVNEMLKKLGYRFVLKQLSHAKSINAGEALTLSMDWENKGNAPSYRNYVLGVQIRTAGGSVVATFATPTQVKAWLPGAFSVDQAITIPSNLAAGQYTVAISIVDPGTKQPKVQLANAGKDGNGWYPLTTLEVK